MAAGAAQDLDRFRVVAMTDTLNSRMAHWFRGDELAVDFALQSWDAAQLWDDLIDEGQAHSDTQALLAWLAFGKEDHPFFKAHAATLRPVMESVYLQWTAANVLELGGEEDVTLAWVLRAGIYGLWHVMARICGGEAWAREIGPTIWRTYGETLAGYRKEMADA